MSGVKIQTRILSWAVNAGTSPLTEIRIDYSHDHEDGEARYAVRTAGGLCLDVDGRWTADMLPSEAGAEQEDWALQLRHQLWHAEVLAYSAARQLLADYEAAGAAERIKEEVSA